jgi:acyl-CoA thioester hydrolase
VTAVLRIEPRWTDLDPVGHVNNNVFLVYAEEARARFLHAALPDTWSSIVVVHNAIDYHHPVVQTDVLEVTSDVDAIGTTSFTTINVIATAVHRCATVRTVQVVLREDRSATRPWTAGERTTLEELLAAGESPTFSTARGTRRPAP